MEWQLITLSLSHNQNPNPNFPSLPPSPCHICHPQCPTTTTTRWNRSPLIAPTPENVSHHKAPPCHLLRSSCGHHHDNTTYAREPPYAMPATRRSNPESPAAPTPVRTSICANLHWWSTSPQNAHQPLHSRITPGSPWLHHRLRSAPPWPATASPSRNHHSRSRTRTYF